MRRARGQVGGHRLPAAPRGLVGRADGDVGLAEYGVVYVDEVDKLAEQASSGRERGVNTRDVQHSLLKLMEDAEVPVAPPSRGLQHSAPPVKGQVGAPAAIP